MSADAASADLDALSPVAALLRRPSPTALWTLGFGVVLTAVAFAAGGGLDLGPSTNVEISLDLLGGAICAGAMLAGRARGAMHGAAAVWLFFGLAALTALSVGWSVQPSDSWLEANRTLTYTMVFVTGVVLGREAPERWVALVGGLALSCTAICLWALLTKVMPAHLAHDEIYARLRAPYDYWNAIGLTAALGAPATLWLGARRTGHAAINALAVPALAISLITVLLAYSRGSALAVLIGLAAWFALSDLRLRGAAVLGVAVAGAAPVAVWTFAQDALSHDNVAIGQRSAAGHQLGVLLVAVIVIGYAAGLALGFMQDRVVLEGERRRKAGIAVLVALAIVPVGGALKLATSPRGLFGSLSHDISRLTNPHAPPPLNAPSRLTAVGSVRARYWNEALKVFKRKPVTGVGAGGFATARTRVRSDAVVVEHAHGYVVQTLADLGLVGLGVSLALLAAWLAAARRAIGPRRRGPGVDPAAGVRRGALITLFSVVVVFGVHSLIDWTWFTPGDAVPAMLCAGWLAGRGPGDALLAPRAGGWWARARRALFSPSRLAPALLAVWAVLAVTWAAWQPLRSQHAADAALAAVEAGDFDKARDNINAAINRNPLSVDPLYDLAAVDEADGNLAAARGALQKAVALQPSNPEPWVQLAAFELTPGNQPASALADARAALFLDPHNASGAATFIAAEQAGG